MTAAEKDALDALDQRAWKFSNSLRAISALADRVEKMRSEGDRHLSPEGIGQRNLRWAEDGSALCLGLEAAAEEAAEIASEIGELGRRYGKPE